VRTLAGMECSTSRVAPIVDTVIAVAGAAGVAYGLGREAMLDDPNDGDHVTLVASAGLAAMIAFIPSAGSGYARAADCRRGQHETALTARR
jgi:hypothetical protein